MVKDAKAAVSNKERASAPAQATNKEKPLEIELAALLYYDQVKDKDPAQQEVQAFEFLPANDQKRFINHAAKVLLMLDQLNKMVVPRVDPGEVYAARMADKDRIAEIIRAFVAKIKVPKNVARFFPVEELAVRIVEGRLK